MRRLVKKSVSSRNTVEAFAACAACSVCGSCYKDCASIFIEIVNGPISSVIDPPSAKYSPVLAEIMTP